MESAIHEDDALYVELQLLYFAAMNGGINIAEYTYDLPAERIAIHPLPSRDQSKLLVWNKGHISHRKFTEVIDYLDVNSLIVFNNTRVIPARLLFTKDTGAVIEIFLLQPIAPSTLVQQTMAAKHMTTWKCAIGNLKRWGADQVLTASVVSAKVTARLKHRDEGIVEFHWDNEASWAEVIDGFGKIPLPPYLKREVQDSDKERYQTVYAKFEGAVAAPTAGLHFTPSVLEALASKGVESGYVTLHVSAGTFMPVKTENALEHVMHEEQVTVARHLIEQLLQGKRVVVVGTTSMRVIESLYWYGCKLAIDSKADFYIDQYDPYKLDGRLSLRESLQLIIKSMGDKSSISGRTSIYIYPGYKFRVCDALITNFHQPGSTLMLLVAAFVGDDWKKIYRQALDNDYRFLSYGDSSILIR